MKTIHRYQKDTIRNQVWETSIIVEDEKITMTKIHFRKDNYNVLKEVSETIKENKMKCFMDKNSLYHIESYQE